MVLEIKNKYYNVAPEKSVKWNWKQFKDKVMYVTLQKLQIINNVSVFKQAKRSPMRQRKSWCLGPSTIINPVSVKIFLRKIHQSLRPSIVLINRPWDHLTYVEQVIAGRLAHLSHEGGKHFATKSTWSIQIAIICAFNFKQGQSRVDAVLLAYLS